MAATMFLIPVFTEDAHEEKQFKMVQIPSCLPGKLPPPVFHSACLHLQLQLELATSVP